jgi:hypothetical protein
MEEIQKEDNGTHVKWGGAGQADIRAIKKLSEYSDNIITHL